MPSYEPLPASLRIEKSEIEGQGLFTLMFLKKDTNLGVSHIIFNQGQHNQFPDEIIRTPLGGFINHSEDTNCTKVKEGHKYYLKTIKDITGGEELTVKYSFYSINKK